MANLPTIKSLRREDIPDAPEWVGSLLTPLNSFISSVYYALDKDITFTENIASSIKEVTLTTRTDYSTNPENFEKISIANPIRTKPVGVQLVKIANLGTYAPIYSSTSLHWDFLDGYVRIHYVSGLDNSVKYGMNLLIF